MAMSNDDDCAAESVPRSFRGVLVRRLHHVAPRPRSVCDVRTSVAVSESGTRRQQRLRTRFFPSLRARHQDSDNDAPKHARLNSYLLRQSVVVTPDAYVFCRVPEVVLLSPGNPHLTQKQIRQLVQLR